MRLERSEKHQIDVGLLIDSTVHIDEATILIWHEHLNHVTSDERVPNEMVYLREARLYWALLEDKYLTKHFDLPRSHEPIIKMYERCGLLCRSYEGIDITLIIAISRACYELETVIKGLKETMSHRHGESQEM